MSTNTEAVARAWFKQVWNDGNEQAISALLAPTAKMHGLPTPDGEPIVGPDAFKPFWQKFRSAFPDMHIDVVRTVTEGDVIAVHCHVTGKHLGHDLGVAATEQPIDLWGMGIARIQDGQIVEAWNCYDFMTLYQQIGVLPLLGAPPAQPPT